MEDYSEEPLAFYYMAAVEVDEGSGLLPGMYKKVVPKVENANMYAITRDEMCGIRN